MVLEQATSTGSHGALKVVEAMMSVLVGLGLIVFAFTIWMFALLNEHHYERR